MANVKKLDAQHRLTPWSSPAHADYVRAQYGAYAATNKEKAKTYVAMYRAKEKEAEEAYQGQQDLLNQSQTMLGQEPQKLPPMEKIVWDPEVVDEEAAKKAEAERKAKEKAEKEAAKAAEKAAKEAAKKAEAGKKK